MSTPTDYKIENICVPIEIKDKSGSKYIFYSNGKVLFDNGKLTYINVENYTIDENGFLTAIWGPNICLEY